MMDLASMTMPQGSFSQRYASQNIQEDGAWLWGALFVLSVVLSLGANTAIVAAFRQVTPLRSIEDAAALFFFSSPPQPVIDPFPLSEGVFS
jgi:hypothetical protein